MVVEQAVTACTLRKKVITVNNTDSAALLDSKEPPKTRRGSEDIQTDEVGSGGQAPPVVVLVVGLALPALSDGRASLGCAPG